MRTLLVALSFLAIGGIRLKAQVTVKGYTVVMTETQSENPARRRMDDYLKGLGDGMLEMAVAERTKLFCPPPKLPLGLETYKNILNSEIKRDVTKMTQAEMDGTPLSTVLLAGLQVIFPCQRK